MVDVDIGTLRATLTIDGTEYEMGLKKAEEETVNFQQKTEGLNTTMVNLASGIYVAQQAFYYAEKAITLFSDSTVRAYDEVDAFNRLTGTSVEVGGKWRDMLERMNLSLSDMTYTFRSFSNNLQTAIADPNSSASRAFQKLGIALTDNKGVLRDNNQLMIDAIAAFQKMPDGLQKTALAFDVFGRGAISINKLLVEGKDIVKDYGAAVSNESEAGKKKVENFKLAWAELNDTLEDTKSILGEGILPAFTNLVNYLNTSVLPVIKLVSDTFEKIGYNIQVFNEFTSGKLSKEEMIEAYKPGAFEKAKEAYLENPSIIKQQEKLSTIQQKIGSNSALTKEEIEWSSKYSPGTLTQYNQKVAQWQPSPLDIEMAKRMGKPVEQISPYYIKPTTEEISEKPLEWIKEKYAIKSTPEKPIPQFAEGGVVPGEKGEPTLAVVHGGEVVVPEEKITTKRFGPWKHSVSTEPVKLRTPEELAKDKIRKDNTPKIDIISIISNAVSSINKSIISFLGIGAEATPWKKPHDTSPEPIKFQTPEEVARRKDNAPKIDIISILRGIFDSILNSFKGEKTPEMPIKGFGDYNLSEEEQKQVSDITKSISDTIEKTKSAEPESPLKDFGEYTEKEKSQIPEFATGGIVPGKQGEPTIAIVHGGEKITPPGPSGIFADSSLLSSDIVKVPERTPDQQEFEQRLAQPINKFIDIIKFRFNELGDHFNKKWLGIMNPDALKEKDSRSLPLSTTNVVTPIQTPLPTPNLAPIQTQSQVKPGEEPILLNAGGKELKTLKAPLEEINVGLSQIRELERSSQTYKLLGDTESLKATQNQISSIYKEVDRLIEKIGTPELKDIWIEISKNIEDPIKSVELLEKAITKTMTSAKDATNNYKLSIENLDKLKRESIKTDREYAEDIQRAGRDVGQMRDLTIAYKRTKREQQETFKESTLKAQEAGAIMIQSGGSISKDTWNVTINASKDYPIDKIIADLNTYQEAERRRKGIPTGG